MANPLKKTYGLIGYPVKHSLSPLMHNAAFASLKINAEYKLFPLASDELGAFLKNLAKNNISGLNVTVPYKEKVIPFLDKLSKEAGLIGAVNTIKASRGRLYGFNTDGEGFIKHLKRDLKFNPKDKFIAIIGAGGAAKAISVFLSKEKPKKISIYDIDQPRAAALTGHLKKNFKNTVFEPVSSVSCLGIPESQLLVNASAVGMQDSDPCLVEDRFIHEDLLVYDLIYNPAQTKLLKIAQAKGAGFSNGLGMLLYQGAAAFELWTGRPAPVEVMRKVLEEALSR
ncbi:MAG: shikimate dehydrogenase [Candidatus Omnitrophica bacterium]|nr:shikimate dehydrogenase [Candidatus Omnitrophota bacterium]